MSEAPDENDDGDGLARLGLSPDASKRNATDNGRPEGAPTVQAKSPWCAHKSFGWSVASSVLWSGLFVFRLVAILAGGPANGLQIFLMIASGVLGVWFGVSAAYLRRTRR